ncbi:MAG: phage tail assembly protein [Hydrogenophaga sp.]|uniref:phage tail assembly protein n=1 Tax=Hydrogenophaga sp. TaxID=1904254 RepID=UPI00271D0C81|nr:phage tail assembly protein [Hydrogenophaga sp.]MDO9571169.1 phage tail assembly protein [Hydrogenophaga sp.]
MPTIHLDTPIRRDGQTIAVIELRKPAAGELRGLSMLALLQMDVDAIATLLPRISTPTVSKPEALQMDPADLLAVGVEVAGFLQQKAETTAYPPQ